jgi:RimJ/RimL family protein N-acetyltransferase
MIPKQLPVETRSLRIRPFIVQDAASVLILSNEETARTWLPSQVYGDYTHALSVLEFLIDQYSTPGNPRHGPYVLAIEHRADSALIGHVGFSPLDDDVEIGFAIAQDYQRQGYATEAIVAGSRWALQTFALNRILGITSAANVASRRSLVRAQFTFKGNKTMFFQGTEQEVRVYALSGNSYHEYGA